MTKKERLTVTVDRDLLTAANQAVRAGRADSLSGWVNQALADRVAKERKLEAMAQALASYESRQGAISTQELRDQERTDRRTSILVRKKAPRKRKRLA